MDVTQNDLLLVQSSGAHPDEKLLAELRKRKLVEKKCVERVAEMQDIADVHGGLQEDLLLRCGEGTLLCDAGGEA